jgi:hypothetical protein
MDYKFYSLIIKYINIGYSEEDAEILAQNEMDKEG